jgi:hypothetical protein
LERDVGQHPSFNGLIRPQQQRWRDRKAKRLGRLQVDDQLEPRGLLDRDVGRLGALEDLVDVDGTPAVLSAILGPYARRTPSTARDWSCPTVGIPRCTAKSAIRLRWTPKSGLAGMINALILVSLTRTRSVVGVAPVTSLPNAAAARPARRRLHALVGQPSIIQ